MDESKACSAKLTARSNSDPCWHLVSRRSWIEEKPAPEMCTEESALPPPAQRVDAAWSSRHSWTTHTRVKACEVVVTARTAVVIPVGTGPRARGTPG